MCREAEQPRGSRQRQERTCIRGEEGGSSRTLELNLWLGQLRYISAQLQLLREQLLLLRAQLQLLRAIVCQVDRIEPPCPETVLTLIDRSHCLAELIEQFLQLSDLRRTDTKTLFGQKALFGQKTRRRYLVKRREDDLFGQKRREYALRSKEARRRSSGK